MKYEEDRLWQALGPMRIEPEGAAITFSAKLARENGWSAARAAAVVEEYRRFLYLAATEREPVSPSDAVDRCWHLHLTYSRHYWEVLCGEILGRPLHHDPSLGGGAEDERHRAQYLATLDRYRATFGSAPPAHVWPDPRRGGEERRSRKGLVGVGGAAAASLLLAACSAAAGGGLDWFSFAFVGFFVVFIGVVVAIAASSSEGKKSRDGGDCGGGGSCGGSGSDSSYDSGSSDSGGSSCGGGGCGGGGGD